MARFITNGKGGDEDTTRQKMRNYWQVYSPTLESMMLSHDASYLAEKEQREIISYLPDYTGKRVLELGAGIGRFTALLAGAAGHVTAVDFMEKYIEENRKRHHHLNNITFKCADVTKLEFPAGSYDLVFSNWLFMYLSDEETSQVFRRVLEWLVPGGHFFMRESCYHQSGNMKRSENPTLYRTPYEYSQMLQESSSTDKVAYRIVRGKSILTYINYDGNPNQLCLLAQRVDERESEALSAYHQGRYTLRYADMMERMAGYTWLCPGGEYTTRDLVMKLGLQPGMRVLDVGCGTGGAAFYLARQYGVSVHGVDLSTNMIHTAIHRQGRLERKMRRKIQFEINDILDCNFENGSYDVIFSRDSLLFIKEKEELFKKFYIWLKSDGLLFFTDYCRGSSDQISKDFIHYVDTLRRYSLVSVSRYAEELHRAGFKDVRAEDLHEDFIRIHKRELEAFTAARQAFVNDFSEEEFTEMANTWRDKIRWSEEGELSWGAFTAGKKASVTQYKHTGVGEN